MQRSTRLLVLVLSLGLLLASWPVAGYAQPMADEPVVQPDFGATSIAWSAPQGSGSFILVVSGPDGYRFEQTFQSGAPLAFQAVDATGAALVDGLYKYELTPVRYDLTKARSAGDDGRNPAETRELVQSQANLNANLTGVSGVFTIQSGAILDPSAVEEETAAAQPQQGASPAGIDAPADQYFADDVIVDGSLCVGFDCVNGESFGFDTIRMKENNVRLQFDDTSTSASFPKNDWRIMANDTTNGGNEYLAFEDSTAGNKPFLVEKGAGANALYVDNGGNVGFGTSTPVVELHVDDGDTPTLRLAQTGASGFTPQIWDMAGNETNFFVRDVTNGSKLPLRIQPSAPTSSIYIKSTGDVGMGAGTSPSASLHVKRTDGTAQILVEEASGTVAIRNMISVTNNGGAFVAMLDTRGANSIDIGNNNNNLLIKTGTKTLVLQQSTGNMTIGGNLTVSGGCTGCRNDTVSSMSASDILSKIQEIPLSEWRTFASDINDLSREAMDVQHLSPDMQAFFATYRLGLNGEQIAPLDVATIAFASAQALSQIVATQQATIDQQGEEIADLQEKMIQLETHLEQLESRIPSFQFLPSVSNSTSE